MKIRMLPILSLVLGFALACSGGSTETTSTTPPPPPPPADGKIGVPECDDYITKMEACIASADPMAKGPMESGLKTTKDAWLQAAAIPQTKGTLASSCQAMLASVPTNCGAGAAAGGTGDAGAAAGTGTPAAGTGTDATGAATGTPAAGTPAAGTTTTTTTTTVVTTTDPKKVDEPVKASSTGARAPARESTGRATDMSRTRDGGGTRDTKDTKSGSGGSTGGMGRSR